MKLRLQIKIFGSFCKALSINDVTLRDGGVETSAKICDEGEGGVETT
jgi:hypothetical protein